MKRFICFLLTVSCLVCTALTLSVSAESPSAVSGAEFTDLGIPTEKHFPNSGNYVYARTVWGMEVFNGKLYIGCGDYDKNAGSNSSYKYMPLFAYGLKTGEWQLEAKLDDEQLTRFFKANNTLYIAGTDPISGRDGHIYYYVPERDIWRTTIQPGGAAHIFDLLFTENDMTVYAGVGLWEGDAPHVPISKNGGKTFPAANKAYFYRDGKQITGADLGIPSGNYARTYNIFEYRGNVYATLWISNYEPMTKYGGLYKYNKEENKFEYYCEVPYDLVSSSMSQSTDFIYKGKFVSAYNNLCVYGDDLKKTKTLGIMNFKGRVSAAKVVGNAVYVLTFERVDYSDITKGFTNRMYKTTDLENFELLTECSYPCAFRSFAYDDGTFYIGTEGVAGTSCPKQNGTVLKMKLKVADCRHENVIHRNDGKKCTRYDECIDCGHKTETGEIKFKDLGNKWYLDAVVEACDRGYMNGMSKTTFEPNRATDRAMIVTVLYNIEGKPDCSDVSIPFTDVKNKDYFADPVKWAYKNKIVMGKSETSFAPKDTLTREQFATILYRYSAYKGRDTSAEADLTSFTDSSSVSKYAKAAVSWANAYGYITGTTATEISPSGSATRAQMATILIRYTDNPPPEAK